MYLITTGPVIMYYMSLINKYMKNHVLYEFD